MGGKEEGPFAFKKTFSSTSVRDRPTIEEKEIQAGKSGVQGKNWTDVE